MYMEKSLLRHIQILLLGHGEINLSFMLKITMDKGYSICLQEPLVVRKSLRPRLPSLLYVYDFKILGDNVYFVGVRDTSTIVGVFNITSLFYYNGGYDLCELQAYSKYPNLYSPKALLRTEVYFYDGIVHIVAVGSQSVNGVYTTAVFDIPYPYTGVYKAVSSDVGYSEGVFYDLAVIAAV